MTPSGRRLTSWKEIASYLGREVRTVTRWEKERSLPVHRDISGRSGVVFADTDELDEWARGAKAAPEAAVPDEAPSVPVAHASTRRWTRMATAATVLTLAVGLGGWRLSVSRANEQPGSVVLTDGAVIARNADGSERWSHKFTPDRTGSMWFGDSIARLGKDGLVVGTASLRRGGDQAHRSGQLLRFNPDGTIRNVFSFDDRLQIGSRSYAAPWIITGYTLNDNHGVRLIAVAARDYRWWPSIVTILDDQFNRKGSFIHAGWVEGLRWLPANRLAIAGFSNLKNGAMVALLDASAIDGQSPAPEGSEFACAACGPGRPLRYVVMLRSEVNRVSAAPFNRASLDPGSDAVVVSTMELPGGASPVSAVYEFSPQLELKEASYSDRYWDAHRDLERLGKISHTREQCPDRDGPPSIEIWEPATGWRVEIISRQRVRTVMRREKERDLPIHRGPDGRSGVVFADMDELEAWTRGHQADAEAGAPDAAPGAIARAAIRRWSAPLNEQSPSPHDGEFQCTGSGPDRPSAASSCRDPR